MKNLYRRIARIMKSRKTRRFLTRAVSLTAALVVFVTTYALVLPAITMERAVGCGIEAHQHQESCFEEVLTCEQEESEGHRHDDSCYTVEKKPACQIREHQHSEENGCYDGEGNLICQLSEHTHDDSCYEKEKSLICQLEEREGHQHTAACYKKVLICEKEEHTHSTACYSDEGASSGRTEEAAEYAAEESLEKTGEEREDAAFGTSEGNAGAGTESQEGISGTTEEGPGVGDSDRADKDSTSGSFSEDSSEKEEEDSGKVLPETLDGQEPSGDAWSDNNLTEEEGRDDQSAELDPDQNSLNMNAMLDRHADIYYFHAGESADPGRESANSSQGSTDLSRESANSSQGSTDLSRESANSSQGSTDLNRESAENTDLSQESAEKTDLSWESAENTDWNQQDAGITDWTRVTDSTRLEPTDLVKVYLPYTIPAASLSETSQTARYRLPYNLHLTDGQIQTINQMENGVSAAYGKDSEDYEKYLGAEAVEGCRKPDETPTESAEDFISAVVKAENLYDEEGNCLGQDLIFTFIPYSVEKNQTTYDADGNVLEAGEEITGWFACDFTVGQIDWIDQEADSDRDATEKTAEIILASREKEDGKIEEISRSLRLADQTTEDRTDAAAEAAADQTAAEDEGRDDREQPAEDEGKDNREQPFKAGILTAEGDGYKVTLDYPAEARIPENSLLSVREITAETDKDAYEECLAQAEKHVSESVKNGSSVDTEATRFFDIEILAPYDGAKEDGAKEDGAKEDGAKEDEAKEDGAKEDEGKNDAENGTMRKIEPAAPVKVSIRLEDDSSAAADEEKKARETREIAQSEPTVLHFADEGVEQIESSMTNPVEEQDKGTETDLLFQAESFSVYGVVYTINTYYISASGETYAITVTYDDAAGIPEGAELAVREILPGEESFAGLYDEASSAASEEARKKGISSPLVTRAHFFDIEIRKGNVKIEPSAPVEVNIRLAKTGTDTDLFSVIHFAESGIEAMQTEEVLAEGVETYREMCFQTQSFSVYTVVGINELNTALAANDGAKYALVSQRGPGIGSYEGDPSASNYAMISALNGQTLSGKAVHMITNDESQPVAAGGDVTEWGFESAGNGNYYIYTIVGETKKYIGRNNDNLILTENSNSARAFNVASTNDGNKVRISFTDNDPYPGVTHYITNQGDNPSSFSLGTDGYTSDINFYLCKTDPSYEELTAQKVSAADWKAAEGTIGRWDETSQVIIYHRFIHRDGSEALYAIATDGTLIQVYDGGDGIYYHNKDNKDLFWHIEEGERGYFVSNSAETIYLSPSKTGNRWQSNTAVGLTMNGMRSTYGTTIEDWDQRAYSYAGLHVDETSTDEHGESSGPEVGAATGDKIDTFLFAVVSSDLIKEGTLHDDVETVDSTALGITMKMFNYGGDTYHNGYRNSAMQAVLGDDMTSDWGNRKSHVTKTVQIKLGDDGFPVTLGNTSTKPLFTADSTISYTHDGQDKTTTVEGKDANHLFLQSYYDENGMFRYSSLDNFAHLNENGDFTVYREAGTPNVTPGQDDHYYFYHGHFMPYNTLDASKKVSRFVNEDGSNESQEEGRTYENIYGISETDPDYYFGMSMEASFVQPRGGVTETGDPIIYNFTGDDDLWVYIDDILVLDVGGIHEALTGHINYKTGLVIQPTYYGSGAAWGHTEKKLYDIFKAAHEEGLISDERWNKMKWKDVDGDGNYDTFADFTNHTFKMFYMERGAGASNLDLEFNFQISKADEFTVQKQLPDGVDTRFDNQEYKFRATFMEGNEEKALNKDAKGTINNVADQSVCTKIIYKDRRGADGRPIEVEVPVDENGYFSLKAGEAAVFKMADAEIPYQIYEVDIDGNLIEKVELNGEEKNPDFQTVAVVTDEGTEEVSRGTVSSGFEASMDRSQVIYKNYPKTQNLLITKHITEDSIAIKEGENPVFEFRVYLESTVTAANSEGEGTATEARMLIPYSYGPYYLIRNIKGVTHYYTLDGEDNKPVDAGVAPVVCSKTGRSGSINSIPPEYTIIIPNLVVGTNFYLEERRDNIPDGYEFIREELKTGTYDTSTMGASSDAIERTIARDEEDTQEFDPDTVGAIKSGIDAESHVYNRRPATRLKIVKKWEKNGAAAEFPEGYKIAWKLIRTSYNQVTEEEVEEEYATSGVFTNTSDGLVLDGSIEGNTDRRLTSSNSSVTFEELPESASIEGNENKKIIYSYKVVEDPRYSEKPEGSQYFFRGQTAVISTGTGQDENTLIHTLTNDLTDVDVRKTWKNAANADSVTVKLYRVEEDPSLLKDSQVVVKASFSGRADRVKNVTGVAVGQSGTEYPFELAWDGTQWIGEVDLPKNQVYTTSFQTETSSPYFTASVTGGPITVGNEPSMTASFQGTVEGDDYSDVTLSLTFTGDETGIHQIPESINAVIGETSVILTKDNSTWRTTIRLPKGSSQTITFNDIYLEDYEVTLNNQSFTVGTGAEETQNFNGSVAYDVGRRIIVNVTWSASNNPEISYFNLFKPNWENTNINATETINGNASTYVWKKAPTDTNDMFVQIGYNESVNLNNYSINVTGGTSSYEINTNNHELLIRNINSGTDDVTVNVEISEGGGTGGGNETGTGSITLVNLAGYGIWINQLKMNSREFGNFGGWLNNNAQNTINNLPAGSYTVQLGSNEHSVLQNQISGGDTIEQWGDNNVNIHINLTDGGNRTITVNSPGTMYSMAKMTSMPMHSLASPPVRSTSVPSDATVILLHDDSPSAPTITGTEDWPTFTDDQLIDTQQLTVSSGSENSKQWYYKWSDLPSSDPETGMIYRYYVVEEVPDNTKSVAYTRTEEEATGTSIVIDNEPAEARYASFKVTKNVVGTTTDRSFTIRLKRTKDGATNWLHFTDSNQYEWGTENNASSWTFTAGGTVSFSGLDTGYTYTAVEDTGTGMVEVARYEFDASESTTTAEVTADAAQTYTGTITNQYTLAEVDINILKVDGGDTSVKLGGAVFSLTKVQSLTSQNQVTENSYSQSGTTSVEEATLGQLKFTGLTPGFYYLREMTPPVGYITTVEGWHFEVTADGIVKGSGDLSADGSSRYVDSSNLTITNEPGAELPASGGPGTRLYTLFGLLLTLGAGGILMMRRRRNMNNDY